MQRLCDRVVDVLAPTSKTAQSGFRLPTVIERGSQVMQHRSSIPVMQHRKDSMLELPQNNGPSASKTSSAGGSVHQHADLTSWIFQPFSSEKSRTAMTVLGLYVARLRALIEVQLPMLMG